MINIAVGMWPTVLLSLALAMTASPVSAQDPVAADCKPYQGIESICGLHAPEDMVVAPDGQRIVFGQMAAPGGLFVLDPRGHQVQPLFEARDISERPLWGEASCTRPPDPLLVHGIDLIQRDDGRWQLLAVNHGERESVEFFELLQEPAGLRALWRGCAQAPDAAGFNDVAAVPGGGFLVTHMADRDSPMWSAFLAVLGFDSGLVYRWHREEGFSTLSSTAGRFPNGIIMAPDGGSFFVNMYFGNKVQKFSFPAAELLGEVSLAKPDNASWSDDGKLLVASHHANLLQLTNSLEQDQGAPSLLPYAIVEIDPASLDKRQLLIHEGPPMGAGTVAIQRGQAVYVGSYAGDRIVRVPLNPGQ